MHNIVVIGGGFAGTTVMRALEHHLPDDWRVFLISEDNYMIYTPLLPEVVGGSMLPSHTVASLRQIVDQATYLYGKVDSIDMENRLVHFADHKAHKLDYDHLILACGTRANLAMIQGMAEHGMPLKTLGDALFLRNRMIERMEEAEQEDDPEVKRDLLRFHVIGGGSSGVEVAGAMSDFFDAAHRQYAHISKGDVEVILITSEDRLLPEFPPSLGEFALHALENGGVEVQFHSRISRVDEGGCEDKSGNRYQGRNVICTIGSTPSELTASLDLPKHKGRITTKDDMSVPGYEGIWAIGDCAAVPNRSTQSISPPTAQFAVRQAQQLAQNIIRTIQRRGTQPFNYNPRGELASVGHHRAVARVFGRKISGFPAWLLWRAFYLAKMPTMLRKLQVYFEWTIGIFFPVDVTQFRYERTQAVQKEKAPQPTPRPTPQARQEPAEVKKKEPQREPAPVE